MADYRILQWSGSFDGPWSENAENRYRDGGFDGLIITPSSTWSPSDLEFLHRLPGLRSFTLQARVRNDLAAFTIPTLEELALVTGSRRRIPDVVQAELLRLTLEDRPGLDVKARWPNLESFRLGVWRGSDLRILQGAENLVRLKLEGRRQVGTLDGISDCRSLEQLITVNYSVRDTAPLRNLSSLVEVRLLAARPTEPHENVDISDIRTLGLVKLWISNAKNIRNIDALSGIRSLRELRFIDCDLSAAERASIEALPSYVKAEIFTS